MQASGEARWARHHNNTWHAKKCKLHTVMRGVSAAGLQEGAVVASELVVRSWFTRVRVLADGQETFEDIPAEAAVIPNRIATCMNSSLTPGCSCKAHHIKLDTQAIYGLMRTIGMLPADITSLHKFRSGVAGPRDSEQPIAKTLGMAASTERHSFCMLEGVSVTNPQILPVCNAQMVVTFYDRDVSAALYIRRCAVGPGPRPTELCYWDGRPAMPKRGRPGQECVYLPDKALHAESLGNVERHTYSIQPDHSVPLTDRGRLQAIGAGKELRSLLEAAYPPDQPYRVFIMTSPYCRTLETTDMLLDAFTEQQVGSRGQVMASSSSRSRSRGCPRNFQEPTKISQDLNDRNKFGRFYFRFPNGESGADVYDRLTIFEDHLTRDMLMGRFASTNLVLVTHGLTLRIFLMRWFHWSVDEFLRIYNPGNAEPVVIERLPWELVQELQSRKYAHAKHCYHITPQSQAKLQGLEANLCSYLPRQTEAESPKARWMTKRGRMAELGHYAPSPPGQSVMDTVDFKLLGAAVAAADITTSTTTSGSSNGTERDKGGLEVEVAESCVGGGSGVHGA
ncbi:hypothetical protein QJQ45_011963 [Haematococcus lacustris]|nr:hypothetical protein QJQ45_011963 [Haematococcus lacustris]